ncbi:LysE family translocator [Alteromonadaceae bacterium M269]|nr:LysE family translocator [Alteromonadaceae bacterium M269]
MFDFALLLAFLPTVFFVSVTPGLCMTLAMTLGMRIGVRRTLWMMYGELIGVAIVATASAMGVASVMKNYPEVFQVLKYFGALYLIYMGWQMWSAEAKLADVDGVESLVKRRTLATQGFITAIANPKGWVFMVSLLPPFINVNKPIAIQMVGLITVITITELCCMLAYASGGKGLRVFLGQGENIKWMNRIAGLLMLAIAIWLVLG